MFLTSRRILLVQPIPGEDNLERKEKAMERLDKLISAAGLASRREVRELVRQGRISVNGRPTAAPDEKLDPETAELTLDGVRVNCARYRYFLMNKPAGVLSATEDPRQKTVLDLLPPELRRIGLGPVGRLDKDTTGLLLLTNDGDMTHRIISPKNHVPKLYRARVSGPLGEADAAAFARGLVLADGTKCLPARLEILEDGLVLVTVYEGKYHQVKRMLASRGAPVLALHRLQIGALALPETLESGHWLELDAKEMQKVLQ